MGLCLANPTDKFVDRETLALVPTPQPTTTWKPVPHIDVVEAVESAIADRGMHIESERFGLARDSQKMFGVLTISNHRNNPEWTRCIGIRNSHDQSFAAGICCGVSVLVCSNLCFGGEHVLKRRHTSGIDLEVMASDAAAYIEDGFLALEEHIEELHCRAIRSDDWARSFICKAAEFGTIPSCDILAVLREYQNPKHEVFRTCTQWSLLNAFTETAHKYPPARFDVCNRRLTRIFGLDGRPAAI
ncbi:MAG: DUF932 domain-containing protein [Victivallales bacterium]|nr:DUF932 domain-containing protein [Victivallales bacterium]